MKSLQTNKNKKQKDRKLYFVFVVNNSAYWSVYLEFRKLDVVLLQVQLKVAFKMIRCKPNSTK